MFEPKSRQGAREADAVNQTEGERHDPGIAGGESDFAALLFDDFHPDERDAQCDAGVERTFRYADHAECCRSKRSAASDREGGDRLHQTPAAADDPDQTQHEQQMICAEQNVIDP